MHEWVLSWIVFELHKYKNNAERSFLARTYLSKHIERFIPSAKAAFKSIKSSHTHTQFDITGILSITGL